MRRAGTLRLAGATAAVAALGLVAGGGTAAAGPEAKADAVVIKAELEGKDVFFEGPKTVERGQVLKFKNDTDPRKIGPHTFSLATKKSLPQTNEEIKACFKEGAGICGAVFKWHDVDLDTGEIGENEVDAGKQGWDTQGTEKRKGDSVVAEREGQSFKRKVTAPEGTTLHYVCAIHPFMQGKIKVEG